MDTHRFLRALIVLTATLSAGGGAAAPVTPGYDDQTCVDCANVITREQRGKLERAIEADRTYDLIATLDSIGTPISRRDHEVLNAAFRHEMRKGPVCRSEHLQALARRGATIELATLRTEAGELAYCNAGFRFGLVPYVLRHADPDFTSLVAFLHVMRTGVEASVQTWAEGQLERLNGRGGSKLFDLEKLQIIVRRYANLIMTIRDVDTLAAAYAHDIDEAPVRDVRRAMDAAIDKLEREGDAVRRARDTHHPRDDRTIVYTRFANLLDEVAKSLRNPEYMKFLPGGLGWQFSDLGPDSRNGAGRSGDR